MGGLPLALDQAGAYLEATRCGLSAYLELFRTQRAALLQHRGEESRYHPTSVSTTFTLELAATAQRHPAVWELLQICALLQPDAIPEELFRQGAEHLGTALEVACRDILGWNQIVAKACSYSLLSRQSAEQTLSMHRLVQSVLLDTMTNAEREQRRRRAIEALNVIFPNVLPDTEYAARKQCERLLPHALLCLNQAEMAEESLALASLASKAAQYLCERGRYAEAEPLYLRALHIREQVIGPDHSLVAHVLNHLANLYLAQGKQEQGKYTDAERFYQQALSIREQQLGQHHPETAQTLHDLTIFYQKQGKLGEATSLAERALSIRSQSLGDAHPKTVATQVLYTQLLQEQAVSEPSEEELPDPRSEERCVDREALSLHETVDPSPSENDPLQAFLDACCELHPRLWCRISSLWQTYEQWTTEDQGRFPLSRRIFAAQLKARGCRVDHTSTARIWRGITLVKKER